VRAKISFQSSDVLWRKSPALPHTNGSHNGMPSTVGVAYSQAPVPMERISAMGPNTNAMM